MTKAQNNKIKKEVRNIKDQLVKKYKPEKIILFGSAVSGKFTKDSDLDFLVIKKNTPYQGRERVRQLYGLIDKEMAADFLVYRPREFERGVMSEDPFIKDIIKTGQVLYEKH